MVDNEPIRRVFESYDIEAYKMIINKKAKEIIIDEIHLLRDPGRAIKIIYDQLENLRIIITGSSFFILRIKRGKVWRGEKLIIIFIPLACRNI